MLCPICSKAFDAKESDAKPFCSQRCQLIDLGRWLGEDYSLPKELDDEDQPPAYEHETLEDL